MEWTGMDDVPTTEAQSKSMEVFMHRKDETENLSAKTQGLITSIPTKLAQAKALAEKLLSEKGATYLKEWTGSDMVPTTEAEFKSVEVFMRQKGETKDLFALTHGIITDIPTSLKHASALAKKLLLAQGPSYLQEWTGSDVVPTTEAEFSRMESFMRLKDEEAQNTWVKLSHVAPVSTGKATVKVQAFDAQTVEPLSANFMLLTPSELNMPAKLIEARLMKLRKKLVKAAQRKVEMTNEEKWIEVRRVIMSIGGPSPGDGVKYNPVGMQTKECKGKCTFTNVAENEYNLVLMQAPGHMFAFDRVQTKGAGEATTQKTYVPKPMKHGQMMVTLAWNEYPSDLDLYVVAPAKHGSTHIGGGKPEHSANEDAKDAAQGVTINWMNKGSATEYPFVNLDVDAMNGYGPETVTVHKPVTGTYKIYVDCYSCSEYDPQSFKEFQNSHATVRVYDRYGLKKEFQIKHALGKPKKHWGVAHRTCTPPVPLVGEHNTKKGFADRDNKWTFSTKSKFYKESPN